MRFAKVLCAVLLMTSVALSGGPVLVITDSGYQLMTVGADGKAVLTEFAGVQDMRGTPGPGPGPTPPPPGETDPIASKVRQWATAVNDPTSQQALSEVYKRVGEASAGQSRERVMAALKQATDGVLTATGGASKWQSWRSNVSALIDAEEAKGPIDWPKFCASVAKGLDTGAALDPVLLQLIINLIMQIVQLFFGGGGGGV